MSSWLEPRTAPAWILGSGLALVALGLAARSQGPTTPPTQTPQPLRTSAVGYGTADSNGRMIAVTGVDVTGGSILYLIDTESRHMSVYSAQGGTASTSNIKWLGGRNIDLDLQVDGFNDKSEISYKELAKRFAENGASATSEKQKQ
jgi:uncharacterized Zn-binding protein involved in type VI secretion